MFLTEALAAMVMQKQSGVLSQRAWHSGKVYVLACRPLSMLTPPCPVKQLRPANLGERTRFMGAESPRVPLVLPVGPFCPQTCNMSHVYT